MAGAICPAATAGLAQIPQRAAPAPKGRGERGGRAPKGSHPGERAREGAASRKSLLSRLISVSQDLRNGLTGVVRRATWIACSVWLKKGGRNRQPLLMAAIANRRSALAAATLEKREGPEDERESAPEGGGINLGDGSRGSGRVDEHHIRGPRGDPYPRRAAGGGTVCAR